MTDTHLWYGVACIAAGSTLLIWWSIGRLPRFRRCERKAAASLPNLMGGWRTAVSLAGLTILPAAAFWPGIAAPVRFQAFESAAVTSYNESPGRDPATISEPVALASSDSALPIAAPKAAAMRQSPPEDANPDALPAEGFGGLLAIGLLWFAGAMLNCIRWFNGWRLTRHWLRTARPIGDGPLLSAVRLAARELALAKPPAVLVSDQVPGPLLVRACRPTVLLPEKLLLHVDAASLFEILAHEFAHAKRGDLWIGLWQRAIGAMYWFQPLVRRLNRAIEAARERACDRQVAKVASPVHYARTLLELAERATDGPKSAWALGLFGSSLEDRIADILAEPTPTRRGGGVVVRSTVVAIIALFPILVRPAGPALVDEAAQPASGKDNGRVDASNASALEGAAVATFPCRRDESEVWITPAGDLHNAFELVQQPGRSPTLVKREAPAGSLRASVLQAAEVSAKKVAKVDVVLSTGNPRSFLPVAVIEEAGATIVGEIDLQKDDPMSLALAGLSNVMRTSQTRFKIARLQAFNLGIGPKGGTIDVLVMDQQKPRIGIVGKDWMSRLRRGEHGLIHDAIGHVYYGRMLDEGDKGARIQLASAGPKRKWDADFADCELRAVGIYTPNGPGGGNDVLVEVGKTAKPLVLSLSAYFETSWNLRVAPDANLRAVVVSGYFEQRITGVPASTTPILRSYFPAEPAGRNRDFFYAYAKDTAEYKKLAAALKALTGLDIARFEGVYQKNHFRLAD